MCPLPTLALSGNGWKRLLAQPSPSFESFYAFVKLANIPNSAQEAMECHTIDNSDIIVSQKKILSFL